MAIYITQGNYPLQSVKGMVEKPEDRMNAVRGLMESVDATLLQYYVTTGEYDFMVIAETDSITNMMAGLMVAGSSGGATNLKTIEAITTQDAKTAMEKANAVAAGFKAAGQ
jgi:uncharacterized protein with GYD domain